MLPIYGGQSYQPQLNALRRGVQWSSGRRGQRHRSREPRHREAHGVGAYWRIPGRSRRNAAHGLRRRRRKHPRTETPPQRQVALFSATIPAPIRRIASKHLRSPIEVTIKSKTSTATNIRQRYWIVSGMHKLDALTRILEAETFDGMLVFTRTKQATVELAEKLEARGFAAAPLNGDIPQPQRERAVRQASKPAKSISWWPPRCGCARPGRRAHRPCRELPRRAV